MHIRYRQKNTLRTATREVIIIIENPLLFLFWQITVWFVVQLTRLLYRHTSTKDELVFVIH